MLVSGRGFNPIFKGVSAPTAASRQAGDLSSLFYTSGTTGYPKGVLITHSMLWAMALMGIKARDNHRERALFEIDLLPRNQSNSILPEDTRDYARPIEALNPDAQQRLLPRTLLTALHRFRATGNIQDVAHTIRATCESESEHLDSELSMIRYIAWAIPSIGFLGTVRGIGQALGQAHQAAQGDIAGVTQSLGVAFNSTFVALLISILIMFLMHQLQLAQERTTQDTEQYCDNRLLRYLQV